jgi:hypothetical protein
MVSCHACLPWVARKASLAMSRIVTDPREDAGARILAAWIKTATCADGKGFDATDDNAAPGPRHFLNARVLG